MPLYEYKCESCGDLCEILQKVSDPPLTTCDACGGALKKLISSPAIQFKGSGFYINDYADKPASGESASGSESSEKKKGDSSKPEKSSKSPSTSTTASDS